LVDLLRNNVVDHSVRITFFFSCPSTYSTYSSTSTGQALVDS